MSNAFISSGATSKAEFEIAAIKEQLKNTFRGEKRSANARSLSDLG
jgi:hypothetical protein